LITSIVNGTTETWNIPHHTFKKCLTSSMDYALYIYPQVSSTGNPVTRVHKILIFVLKKL